MKKEGQVAANMCGTSFRARPIFYGDDRGRETHPVSRLALRRMSAQSTNEGAPSCLFPKGLFLEHALAPGQAWSRALSRPSAILRSALQVLRMKPERARRTVGSARDEQSFCVLSICNGLSTLLKLLGLKYFT